MQEKEKSAGKAKDQKKSWFHGLKAEFRKIVWTDRETLMKQTAVVIVISVLLGALISVMDAGILECITLLIK